MALLFSSCLPYAKSGGFSWAMVTSVQLVPGSQGSKWQTLLVMAETEGIEHGCGPENEGCLKYIQIWPFSQRKLMLERKIQKFIPSAT